MMLPLASTTKKRLMTTPAIDVDRLTHTYGDRRALDAVSFSVNPGEIFGILGPNGGGKTTLFSILSTALTPSDGTARIFGDDVVTQPNSVRQSLGVVFQSPSLDVKLTARENLVCQASLYGLRGADLAARVDDALQRVNLADRAGDFAEAFSGGMRRRVELAKAMLHHPRLLLLDEPATGLDPGARRDMWDYLLHLRDEQNVTVALTTHLMEDAEKCDRLAVLHHGKLVAVDSPANLKAAISGDVITIKPKGEAETLAAAIAERFAIETAVTGDHVHLKQADGPAFVATLAAAYAADIQSITVGSPTLDDVFHHLTGDALTATQ